MRDRVHTHDQLDQSREEGPLVGQKMTMAVVDMIMKEVHGFSQMEVVHAISMLKIRGAFMQMVCISLVNAEVFHLQGGRKTILTECPERTRTQDGLWNLALAHHLLIM